jgi:hypothetical protein
MYHYPLQESNLYLNHSNPRLFDKYIQGVALKIRRACGVNDWQSATEKQLKERDTIHDNISLLASVLKVNDESVRLGIQQKL